jgi:exopolysaccharide biosynthesis polyprenyl glycosylphosphotransferase
LIATKGWKPRVQKTQTLAPIPAAYQPVVRSSSFASGRIAIRLVQMVLDAGLAFLAFYIAYLLRYRYELGGDVMSWDHLPFAAFQQRAFLFAGVSFAILLFRGIYWLPRSTGLLDESILIIGSITTAMAVVIMTAFLTRFVPSRLVFILAWAIAIMFLVGRRVVSRTIRTEMWKRGMYVDRVLVVGTGESGRRIMEAMLSTPSLGYQLVGFADDLPETSDLSVATEYRVHRAPRLGSLDDLERIVSRLQVHEVIIALPATRLGRAGSIIEQCRAQSVRFKVVPDLFQLSLDRVDLGEVAGLPLIGVKPAAIQGPQLLAKRAIDFLAATLILSLLAIPMAIIAIAIKVTSPGPVLFRQTRIGRDGKPFTLMKFRCMVDGADDMREELLAANGHQDPRLFKLRDDPRLTHVGRILRRCSLDEVPQFWQVLIGEMSLVGPRPQLPEEVAGYEDWHFQRLAVSPGMTGLWQVNGRSNLSFDDMVRLDLYYAEHWSPWLDTKVVLRTIPAVITGRGAY